MWDRSKIYGYTEEEAREDMKNHNGDMPADNEIMVESFETERLKVEEIWKLFPCQDVCLVDVEWEDPEYPGEGNIVSGVVKYYHCNHSSARIMYINGEVGGVLCTYPESLEGDVLWL